MNEQDFAKDVARLLNRGLTQMDDATVMRLNKARGRALEAYHEPERVRGMSLAGAMPGGGGFSHGHDFHADLKRWFVPVSLAVIVMICLMYWFTVFQNSDIADIDVGLLSDDLPIEAYFDQDFLEWLEDSNK
jgi:hypothetical protein